jgi:hypothetical protein
VGASDARGHRRRVPAVRGRCSRGGLRLSGLGARLDRAVALGCGPGGDPAQHGADRHCLIGLDEDLRDRARDRRGDLRVDLVRGDLDERVVDRDGVAHLHAPLEHGALGDRIAHLREGNVSQLAADRGRVVRRCRSGSLAVGLYLAEHTSHLNRVIGFGGDVYKRSGCGCRNLGIHLVGRDLDQRLVGLDPVPDLFQPTQDGAFGNRLPHLGHGDLNARGARGHPSPQL